MRTKFLLLFSLTAFLFSCQNETVDIAPETDGSTDPSLINKSATVDGVSYSLKNVAVNPAVKILNETNSLLISKVGNKYEVEIKSSDISISANDIIYLQLGETSSLIKVVSVSSANNVYTLETEGAALGDLIKSGSLELSVDIDESEKILKSKNSALKSVSIDNGFTIDILNAVQPFVYENFTANLNTTAKAFFNIKVGFGAGILPNEVVATFEFRTAFNPYFVSTGSVNGDYAINFIDKVPSDLLDQLKAIDISIDIPLGDIGTLPAKVGIESISVPTELKVNASEQFDLRFNANGVFKVGYAYYNNIPGKKSGFIYENTMITNATPDIKLNGELASDMRVDIVPRISLVDNDILKVSGNISFGLNTLTSGGIDYLKNEYVGGSVGTFNSVATIKASSYGITLFSTDLFKSTQELWNVGTFNKKFAISNVVLTRPSKTQSALRSYNFPITVDYKYPIVGKKITNSVEVAYDVYDDTNKLLAGNQKVTLQPQNVSDNTFTFTLSVPFRINALGFTTGFTRNTGSIRNLKITDSMGNVAELGSTIALGSPYNNSFWK